MTQQNLSPIIPGHPRWEEFLDRLCGSAACDFRAERWTCFGDTRFSRAILLSMGLSEAAVERTLAIYRRRGGHCDCEVVFNVSRSPVPGSAC